MEIEAAAEDEEKLNRKIQEIQDELRKPITDPVKESTVDYYMKNKDKVRYLIC